MKKKLLALAVLGSLAASSYAQSNVALFGVVDLGLERTTLSPGASTLRLSSGIQSGSRWGLKGTEDLGGGLSASFKLESGFDASTGAAGQGGLAFGRQAWVGLNGGFGSLKLGRQYTPIFGAIDTVDPFDAGITGDGSGIAAVFRSYGVRMNNTINYSTPTMGGFSGELAYGLGEFPGSTSTGSQWGGALNYATGPLTLVAAYHDQGLVTAGASNGNARTLMIGGVYDLTAVKLHAAFADNRDKNGTGAATARSRDYMVGVTVPVGALALLAEYVRHNDTLVANADASYYQLGATYDLSKRTNFYTSYSTIRNQSAGDAGGNTGVPGTNISWLNVGIRHRF
jgi:predicted porin